MQDEQLTFDLIVIGAGMAGLSAAARAAEAGLRVVVIEAAAEVGGSAAMSGGILWTLESTAKMAYHGGGDPAFSALVAQGYRDGVAWLRGRDVHMSNVVNPLNGRGYQADLLGHFAQAVVTVEGAGGIVVRDTRVERLLTDAEGRVVGAHTVHADGEMDIFAPWTLLSTGGFQGSAELREAYLGPNGRSVLLRSNPTSDGAGLRLGTAAGGDAPKGNLGFYGHLVSGSPAWGDPRLFTRLSQYHSDYTVLLNEAGHRFCDESEGDHANTHQTLQQPGGRALMVSDDAIHQAHGVTAVVEVAPPEDRMQVALEHGGEGIVADTLDEIASFAGAHGFDRGQCLATLSDYNRCAREDWENLSPPRVHQPHKPLARAPYYGLIVYPAITFTFAGLRCDDRMRVLRADGAPVGGLLAAGADVGDVYRGGYGGGLAAALTTGLRAAGTVMGG
ncbi:FAD-dependent oxidoreductase [Rhizorhabdus dicambivorans]|uniref:FAD-binding dehydrogenase n=1 Tax=Rhizorhabdus dicambivorans TaxID=1850238 RepID=A0A2A4FVW9_9SPHN|nr:FAD-dependent oxidoreductase [Rhizorhabdus dicambivorans]ATE67450.1 FAD-binding dehydrogenase [Rhizorhabdus dicambivorans]PCE41822.1 FAD-binding dehydrogenase [Rhizorhabdus dicambivorans]